ncbi:MAG: LacI family DNA-binding transcriptional regulator [Capsulimonadaceae bacterium]|nr:LacI family DNA-binding transcriptional regulator [Capsulimonadaceae bacterium]
MTIRRHQKSTIKDVAERAKVSATTVSMFASGRENVCSPDTAERIREAITHLRYTPNSLSRSLRTRSTQTIGISISRPQRANDARYSYVDRLWAGIDTATDEAGYLQLCYPASMRYGTSLDPFLDGRIDGLLFATSLNDYRVREIADTGMPIVLVGRGLEIPEGCGAVYADEQDTMNLGLTHLWELGHRRIAHIAGPCVDIQATAPFGGIRSAIALQRRAAFVDWMTAHGAFDPALVAATARWERDESRDAVRSIVEQWLSTADPPTAIFSANDAHALTAIETIQSHGLDVPHDISVLGVDNQIQAMLAQPALTTIAVPAEAIGERSVRILLMMISGASPNECHEIIPVTELIVRGTTAAAKPVPQPVFASV